MVGVSGRCQDSEKMNGGSVWNRWSDCGCSSCVDGMENGNQKLYVAVREPPRGNFLTTYCLFVLLRLLGLLSVEVLGMILEGILGFV